MRNNVIQDLLFHYFLLVCYVWFVSSRGQSKNTILAATRFPNTATQSSRYVVEASSLIYQYSSSFREAMRITDQLFQFEEEEIRYLYLRI